MSANLIGFMLAGPAEEQAITKEQITRARHIIQQTRAEAERIAQAAEPGREIEDSEKLPPEIQHYLLEEVPTTPETAEDVLEWMEAIEELLDPREPAPTDSQIAARLKTLQDDWLFMTTMSAFVAMRDFQVLGQRQRVAFAGEETWGDEPQSDAYDTFKMLSHNPLAEVVGIV